MDPVDVFGIFFLVTIVFAAISAYYEDFFKKHALLFRIIIYTIVIPVISLLSFLDIENNDKGAGSGRRFNLEEYQNSGLKVTTDVNLRDGPSVKYKSNLVVRKNEIVNLLDKKSERGWYYVRYKEITGWIYQKYLVIPDELQSRFGTKEMGVKLLYFFVFSDDADPQYIIAFFIFSLIFSFGATAFSYVSVPNVGTLIIFSVSYYFFMFYYNDIVVAEFSTADKIYFFGGLLLYTIIVDLLGDLFYYLTIKDHSVAD